MHHWINVEIKILQRVDVADCTDSTADFCKMLSLAHARPSGKRLLLATSAEIFAARIKARLDMLRSRVLCIRVALACVLTLCVRADFELNQVPGLYFLRRGPPSCEEDIVMSKRGTTVQGVQIRGKNFECRGGAIAIERGTIKNGNVLTKYLARGLGSFGVFLIGTVNSPVSCGQRGGGSFQFPQGLVFNFIDPRIDIDFKFKDVFSESAPLYKQSDVKVYDEVEYMFIGDECLYRQSWFLCFPASAKVELKDGRVKRMDQVEIGDQVKTAAGQYSRVFMWTHKQPTQQKWMFLRLATDTGHSITLTHAHHIHASGRLVAASKVKVGDTVHIGDGRVANVVSVSDVEERGFYNPQTLHGDIVVNGIVASTYTKAVPPNKAHAMLAPLRSLYKLFSAARQSAALQEL